VLDTLKLSRRLLPDQPTHRLGALAEALHLIDGLPPGLTPHRASYDALVAARLFVYLATKPDGTPRSFDDLHNEPRRGDETLF
jgi:DNA polymerase III epsilon subunit-like protein